MQKHSRLALILHIGVENELYEFIFLSSQESLIPTIQPAIRNIKVPNMVCSFCIHFPHRSTSYHLLVQSQ